MAYSRKYDISFPHRYQTLISKDLFARCQEVRQGRKATPSKQSTKEFVLQGILKCHNCGCAMSPEYHKKPSGREYYIYSCTNGKGVCKREYVNENKLLEPIYGVLERFGTISEEVQEILVEELRKSSEAELTFHKKEVARIQKDYNKHIDMKSSLVDLFVAKSITKPDYDKKLQEYSDQIQGLHTQLEQHSNADHDYKTSIGAVLDVARRAKDIFESSEVHEKQAFLKLLLQNPTVNGKELVFELNEPFNYVLELADVSSQKSKTTNISVDRPAWLREWDSNPRPTG
ncbi:hypothetical protein HOI83_00095 [Candidatus Uhrbacteria bacterium]|nr:hypothetical protein [Candidatus Uhrbacteria bacterium]